MKKTILFMLLGFFLAACSPVGPDPKPVDSEIDFIEDSDPNTNERIEVWLTGYSNLSDYINVSYRIVGLDEVTERGTFKNFPSFRSFEPKTGSIKLAVYAEQIQDIPQSVLDSPDGITFGITASVTTPHYGKTVNWCRLQNSSVSSLDELISKTINTLNSGTEDGIPGTGNTGYIQFNITQDEAEHYLIDLVSCKGNLFE